MLKKKTHSKEPGLDLARKELGYKILSALREKFLWDLFSFAREDLLTI